MSGSNRLSSGHHRNVYIISFGVCLTFLCFLTEPGDLHLSKLYLGGAADDVKGCVLVC